MYSSCRGCLKDALSDGWIPDLVSTVPTSSHKAVVHGSGLQHANGTISHYLISATSETANYEWCDHNSVFMFLVMFNHMYMSIVYNISTHLSNARTLPSVIHILVSCRMLGVCMCALGLCRVAKHNVLSCSHALHSKFLYGLPHECSMSP